MGRRLFVIAALWVGCTAAVPLALAAGALDGKTFSGVIGQTGQTATQPDDLIFQDGTFESTLCTTQGYGKAAYKTKPLAEGLEFTVEATSANGGRKQWHGVANGDQIEATVVSMENGETTQWWFQGSLRAPEAPAPPAP